MSQRLHSTQAGRSASTEKVKKAGLDLVVGVVRKKDSIAIVGLGAGPKKYISQFTRGGLEGEFFLRGMVPNIGFSELEGVPQFSRGGTDKR
jgi:hypothetical protein